MPATMQSLGIDALPLQEQIALAQEIWNHIAAQGGTRLTAAQRAELQRRMAEDDANSDHGIPWETVRDEALQRIVR